MPAEWITYHQEPYTISTDPARLDIPAIHRFLSEESYWAKGRSFEIVQNSIANSLNFGVYLETQQVGFARVVTDYATFSWLCDVFILPAQRGQGLSKWLVNCVIQHPDLKNIRRILLATTSARELYIRYGAFTPIHGPERWLERFNPGA